MNPHARSFLGYGITGYVLFLATFLYLLGFVVGLPLPRTVSAGGALAPPGVAITIDVLLVALFGVQHSIMARPGFKRRWTKLVPEAIERTTFMVATCAVFAVMFTLWRPLPQVIWNVPGPAGALLDGLGYLGWGIVLLSTFLIDHFDLFGLRQTWLYFRGRPYTQRAFQARSLYRVVRHPLMLGFLIAFFATGHMTLGRLVLAVSFALYIVIALALEEQDLLAIHGDAYATYRRQVPKLIPFSKGLSAPARSSSDAAASTGG